MVIPIFNTIYGNDDEFIKSKNLDLKNLNNLNFKFVDKKRFPLIDILRLIPEQYSLFETVLVSANDTLVNLFLENKITYIDLQKKLKNLLN